MRRRRTGNYLFNLVLAEPWQAPTLPLSL